MVNTKRKSKHVRGGKKDKSPKHTGPLLDIGEDVFYVQWIEDERDDGKGGKEYLIKWRDYPKHCNTWESYTNVVAVTRTVIDEWESYKRRVIDPPAHWTVSPLPGTSSATQGSQVGKVTTPLATRQQSDAPAKKKRRVAPETTSKTKARDMAPETTPQPPAVQAPSQPTESNTQRKLGPSGPIIRSFDVDINGHVVTIHELPLPDWLSN